MLPRSRAKRKAGTDIISALLFETPNRNLSHLQLQAELLPMSLCALAALLIDEAGGRAQVDEAGGLAHARRTSISGAVMGLQTECMSAGRRDL
jgi:hypothetical protein